MEKSFTSEEFELRLSHTAGEYLRESAKWSFFLSIVGFIGIGFMVLVAIFIGSVMDMASMGQSPGMGAFGAVSGMMSGFYILLAILYAFPVYYMFKYATDTKTALATQDSALLETALGYLKSHHKFLGIMMAIILSLYALILIGALIVGATAASMM